MKILERKSAIITGGTRGIGKAILERYKAEGCKVLMCSRHREDIEMTCNELDPSGEFLFGMECDVSDYADCKKLIDRGIELFGKIDVLINNAGVYGPIGPLETNNPEEWLKAIKVNLLGAVYTSHCVIPHMKKEKSGKIINFSGAGIGGVNPLARFSSYYTSKGAIVEFTEVLASELLEYNIQVNCISPGAVSSQLTEYLLQQDKELVGEDFYNKNLEIKASGGDSPMLAAELVVFLASESSNHIAGKQISAKWDDIEKMKEMNPMPKNLYNLRRIDNHFFYEKGL